MGMGTGRRGAPEPGVGAHTGAKVAGTPAAAPGNDDARPTAWRPLLAGDALSAASRTGVPLGDQRPTGCSEPSEDTVKRATFARMNGVRSTG